MTDYNDLITIKELIEWLDQVFPLVAVNPKMTINDVMYNSGQRDVINILLKLEQTKETSDVLLKT